MNIDIEPHDKASQIITAVKQAPAGAEIRSRIERQYSILKIAVIKLQRDDLSLTLMDGAGRIVKQVTARKRHDEGGASASALSAVQLNAVRDVEKAFRRCRELKLMLVGFSDGLVAVPESLGCGAEVLSSPDAVELDTHEAYHGYDDELE